MLQKKFVFFFKGW